MEAPERELGKDNKALPGKQTWAFIFSLEKQIGMYGQRQAGQQRCFHAKQWQECLGDPVEATHINVYWQGE